ncbi:MAG: hypothetical protein ACK5Q5_10045 [Planctomycetaceae bacterium]
MKCSFETWSFDNLKCIRDQLEESLRCGEDYPDVRDQLVAVEREIANRRFCLVGTLSGRIVKEYGRWSTRQQCEASAEQMGLPVRTEFELSGQRFQMEVKQLS